MYEDLFNFGLVGDFLNGSENFRLLVGVEFCWIWYFLVLIMFIKVVYFRLKFVMNFVFDIEFF